MKWISTIVQPAAFIAFAVLALFYADSFQLFQLTRVASLAMVVVGLGLLTGRGGQISAGHSALMGAGAYITAGLMVHQSLSAPAAVAAAVAGCILLGIVFGLPALRISGFSLAIVTLGLAVVFPPVLKRWESVTGGANGISTPAVRSPLPIIDDAQWLFLLTALTLGGVVLMMRWIITTSYARRLEAVRVNEDMAEALGIRVPSTKLAAFALSAGLAGLGGSFNQLVVQSATPDSYTFALSLSLIVAVVVGGLRSLAGGVLGAAFIVFVPEYAGTRAPALVFALVLLLVVYLIPEGLAGVPARLGSVTRRLVLAGRRPTTPPQPAPAHTAAGGSTPSTTGGARRTDARAD